MKTSTTIHSGPFSQPEQKEPPRKFAPSRDAKANVATMAIVIVTIAEFIFVGNWTIYLI